MVSYPRPRQLSKTPHSNQTRRSGVLLLSATSPSVSVPSCQSSTLPGIMVYRRQRGRKRRSSSLLYRSMNISFENRDVLPRVRHCTKGGLHRAADCKDEYPARKRESYKMLECNLLNTLEIGAPAAQRAMSVTCSRSGWSWVGWHFRKACNAMPQPTLPSAYSPRSAIEYSSFSSPSKSACASDPWATTTERTPYQANLKAYISADIYMSRSMGQDVTTNSDLTSQQADLHRSRIVTICSERLLPWGPANVRSIRGKTQACAAAGCSRAHTYGSVMVAKVGHR